MLMEASIPESAIQAVDQFDRSNTLPSVGRLRMVIFAQPLFALLAGVSLSCLLLPQMRAWTRQATKGVCAGCGYNLRGNVSGICPECGKPDSQD
jgi:hypothetical protein